MTTPNPDPTLAPMGRYLLGLTCAALTAIPGFFLALWIGPTQLFVEDNWLGAPITIAGFGLLWVGFQAWDFAMKTPTPAH